MDGDDAEDRAPLRAGPRHPTDAEDQDRAGHVEQTITDKGFAQSR